MDQLLEWFHGEIVSFFSDFFAEIGDLGAQLFTISWVQTIVLFFSYLGWALFVVGTVVAVFETAIAAQNGHGDIRGTFLNIIKGFFAVSLFTTAPVELYKLAVTLQGELADGITGSGSDIGTLAELALDRFTTPFGTGYLLMIFTVIMIGYAVIKVFFSSLKRGGILLIQIAVGSLYMFSVPRGYADGFYQWCKQVIGLCMTTFLQATILTAGLMMIRTETLLGLGLMLSAGEVPRVCGTFGMDTSTRANFGGAIHTVQSTINVTQAITKIVSK